MLSMKSARSRYWSRRQGPPLLGLAGHAPVLADEVFQVTEEVADTFFVSEVDVVVHHLARTLAHDLVVGFVDIVRVKVLVQRSLVARARLLYFVRREALCFVGEEPAPLSVGQNLKLD
jgi:hypothetical protein